MEDLLVPIVALLCIFVFLPGMVLWFIDRRSSSRSAAGQPITAASQDLLRVAERMEQRIEALEKILDVEAPGWRNRNVQ